jgi:hypothetical protein
MSKYDSLMHHLMAEQASVELTFAQLESILGFGLPPSARLYAAWWSNSGGSHVQSHAWLAAGFRTEDVDLAGQTVRFVRDIEQSGFREGAQAQYAGTNTLRHGEEASKKRHPLFGIWRGLVTLDPDYDYTQPADPDWARAFDE